MKNKIKKRLWLSLAIIGWITFALAPIALFIGSIAYYQGEHVDEIKATSMLLAVCLIFLAALIQAKYDDFNY